MDDDGQVGHLAGGLNKLAKHGLLHLFGAGRLVVIQPSLSEGDDAGIFLGDPQNLLEGCSSHAAALWGWKPTAAHTSGRRLARETASRHVCEVTAEPMLTNLPTPAAKARSMVASPSASEPNDSRVRWAWVSNQGCIMGVWGVGVCAVGWGWIGKVSSGFAVDGLRWVCPPGSV